MTIIIVRKRAKRQRSAKQRHPAKQPNVLTRSMAKADVQPKDKKASKKGNKRRKAKRGIAKTGAHGSVLVIEGTFDKQV